jgi:hypothetical protein
LAAVAAPLLPAAPLALSIATSREVRSATCFSSATSRCRGADSTAAPEDAEGPRGVDGTGTRLLAAAVLAPRVEATLAATGLLARPSALAVRADTDIVAFFVVDFFVVAFFAVAFFAAAFFAGTFVLGAADAAPFRVAAFFFAGGVFLAVTAAAVVCCDVVLARAALPVLAGADVFLATALAEGLTAGLACAAA